MSNTLQSIVASLTAFFSFSTHHDVISLFPLDHYDQTLTTWIKPTDPNYQKPLLDQAMQQQHMANFYKHYLGDKSPWNAGYVTTLLQQSSFSLKALEQDIIYTYSNSRVPPKEIGYGENFRPHTKEWMDNIAKNIDLNQLTGLHYVASQRGILIDNAQVRALPTDNPHFYSYTLAGQGYPFDNFNMSAAWAGMPIYIFAETRDHAWSLILTPDYIGWVKSNTLAKATEAFVQQWEVAAKHQLAAITQTQTGIKDQKGVFRFSAYIGTVLPAVPTKTGITALIPVINQEGQAAIHQAALTPQQATLIPLAATPEHFATLMSSLMGRPYGWGNAYFYNDCSSELKNLYIPFGIWLPRHSSEQVIVGKMVDMSAANVQERLDYLIHYGHPFFTTIYVGGHIMLYMGHYPNPMSKKHEPMALSYQTVWGLSPAPPTRRAILGQTVFFPLLAKYPEDKHLVSQANKPTFQIGYLDEMPQTGHFALPMVDLNVLMDALMSRD